MKLGNYKWMVCGKTHKCKKASFLRRIWDDYKKRKAEEEEEEFNKLMNAGEDKRGNPIF